MRIALVFALAGAALVGCTKDYSGDISDLNKKVSEQQSAVTALQNAVSNAQTAADAAASTANTALSTAKAAATADELNAVKAELAKAATADALTAVDAKYAAYIPAIEAAAKAADLDEFKTLVAEEIAKLATKDEVAAFKAAYDEMVAALDAADKQNDGKIAELKAACDTKFAALDAADTKNAEAIVALQEALENAIENAQAADKQNEDAIAALTETFNATVAELQAADTKNAEAIEALKADYEAKVAALEAGDTQNAEAIAALKADYEAKVAVLEAADTKNAEAIAALKADYEAQVVALKAADEKNAEGLKTLEEVVSTAIAATNVSIADIEAALATKADKTDLDAAVARILALETNYIELKARVLALEKADEDIRALIAENKAGIAENKAAIEALEAKVKDLLSGAYTDLTTVNAPASAVIVNFDYAEYAPSKETKKGDTYKALAEAFPEIETIEEGGVINEGGHVPFIVNPTGVVFDDSYSFEFVGTDGKAYPCTLTDPQPGFIGVQAASVDGFDGKMTTKANNGWWTISFRPNGWDKKNKRFESKAGLSLVISKDGEVLNSTPFVYAVVGGPQSDVNATINPTAVKYAPVIDLLKTKAPKQTTPVVSFTGAMTGKYIFAASEDNDEFPENSVNIEKYGVSFDGSSVSIANYPAGTHSISFGINVKVLGLNGSVCEDDFQFTVAKDIDITGVLAAKNFALKSEVDETYEIRWNLSDYDFASQAEKLAFITADTHTLTFYVLDKDGKRVEPEAGVAPTGDVTINFYKKDGSVIEDVKDWSKAVTFGFDIEDNTIFAPGEYPVYFEVSDDETVIYAAESTFTVTNDETVLEGIKVLDSICDENGVLLAVGSAAGGYVTYSFDEAIVIENDAIKKAIVKGHKYVDLDFVAPKEGETYVPSVANYNWINDNDKLDIPANGEKDGKKNKYNYVNNTVRNIRVNLEYLGNSHNTGVFDFQVKVLSPIYSEKVSDVITVKNPLIYFTPSKDRPNSFKLSDVVTKAVYAAGLDAGNPYSLFTTVQGGTPAVYYPDYTSYAVDKDGFLATDEKGNLKKFNKDELRDAGFITTTEWMSYAANSVFYVNIDGYMIKEGTSAQINLQWNLADGASNWNETMVYNPSTLKFENKLEGTTATSITIRRGDTGWYYNQTVSVTINVPDSQVKNVASITASLQSWARLNWNQRGNATALRNQFATMNESTCQPLELTNNGEYFDAFKDQLIYTKASENVKVPEVHGVTVERATELKKVIFTFDDPAKAAKFIDGNDFEWTDEDATVTANQNYATSDLPGNQVTLGAKVTITDQWGMTMVAPFSVTCKINN